MSDNLDPVIKIVLGLVQDGLYGRFHRDPILAQAHGRKIKVDLGDGSFLTREYTSQELAQVPPPQLAAYVLNGFANEQKKRDLLGYAREKFPDASSVRLVDDGIYDDEVVGAVVELKLKAVRVLAGLTRELWDHAESFADLRRHMDRAHWRETVNNGASQKVLLGQQGWLDNKDWS